MMFIYRGVYPGVGSRILYVARAGEMEENKPKISF